MTRILFPAATAAVAILPVAALAAGAIETAVSAVVAPYIDAAIMTIVGLVVGWLAATSERFAAPARKKSPEERTRAEKAIIEIDRRIDQINIGVIETFAVRWVRAHLDELLGAQVFDPMRQAEAMVDNALKRFAERNPQIAEATGIDRLTMQEILAAVIGHEQKDALAAALRAAGAPAVDAR